MPPKAGDTLPDVILYEGTPLAEMQPNVSPINPVKLRDVFAGKKGILFAVPGAFTPGCSKTHLPGYVTNYELFKTAGAEVIACVAVNDPFVMAEWGAANQTKGKVRMLSDTHAELAKALDVVFDATERLGGMRSKRYSAVVKDNVITHFNLEDGGMSCSLAEPTLAQLKEL